MNITLRLENKDDHRAVEHLTREAFWDLFQPGCTEHLIVHQMRTDDSFIPELDYVALDGDTIVGNIMHTKAKVRSDSGEEHEVLCMGPVAVLPSYQGKGVGSLLIKRTIAVAKAMGYTGIVIYGDHHYYHRFGYKNAEVYGIQTGDGANFDAFMALELTEGALAPVSGRFHETSAFQTKDEDVEAFDALFPYKEKKRKEKLFLS